MQFYVSFILHQSATRLINYFSLPNQRGILFTKHYESIGQQQRKENKTDNEKEEQSNQKFLTLRCTALHPRVWFAGKVLDELRTMVGDRPLRKRV